MRVAKLVSLLVAQSTLTWTRYPSSYYCFGGQKNICSNYYKVTVAMFS